MGSSSTVTCSNLTSSLFTKHFASAASVMIHAVMFLLQSLEIDETDVTFTENLDGSSKVDYGTAYECKNYIPNKIGLANMDLRGTGFFFENMSQV